MLRRWCGVVFSCVCLVPVLAWAQSQNSGISGTVTDPSGAVIPNAELTLTSVLRQTTAKTTSGSDGLYSFPNLEPGSYELNVTAAGFKPLQQKRYFAHRESVRTHRPEA